MAALQAGSAATARFGHRGYRLGCNVVSSAVAPGDIAIRLNSDAVFSMPFADGYWSRLLNRRYVYEAEIETFLRGVSDVDYVFVDGGANFGYWSVLASSRPFGAHDALAIEASAPNVSRLEFNSRLNGCRFRCIHAAIGGAPGGFVRITGDRHEAFGTARAGAGDPDAVRTVSLDGLMTEGAIEPARPVVVKLDVEGVEIEALRGAELLSAGDAVFICEEHGADRRHLVSRHRCRDGKFRPAAGPVRSRPHQAPRMGGIQRFRDREPVLERETRTHRMAVMNAPKRILAAPRVWMDLRAAIREVRPPRSVAEPEFDCLRY
ncbi:MAG: FkbM family methyltransferase [Hyphomicrobiales bacterium]|nr:FkbM family methyltransferase [Hyphomicrobiales bacterium]